MSTATLPPDPVQLVASLDAEQIRGRLDDLDRERSALMVLLRAALRVNKQEKAGAGRPAAAS